MSTAAVGLPLLVAGPAPAAGAAMTPAVGNYVSAPLARCQLAVPAACYGPAQIRAAYGIQPVLDRGITGKGRTIVLIDAFSSPTLQADLATFDGFFQLPAPPALNVIYPDGPTPFNGHDPIQIGWALEIAVDVEWAHATAPGATIDLVLARSGTDADMLRAIAYAEEHRLNGSRGTLGDVMSLSFGEAEQCASKTTIARGHQLFDTAREERISVFAASGDQGATQMSCDGSSPLGSRAVSTPASDPNVTAVGGTHLVADGATGAYQSESAWTGSGGGFSTLYRRPSYQRRFDEDTKGRGVPDVAINADPHGFLMAVWSLLAPPGNPGFGAASGTSAATPIWAGIAALADQAAGHRLGMLNTSLYRLSRGDDGSSRAFHDITTGNNSFHGVVGFSAAAGWDPVTGLGSPNVARIIHALGGGSDHS